VAAPASGAGKTTIVLALIAAARRRRLVVQPFKVGPDFIDPGHHTRLAGRPARTLDGWMLGADACRESFAAGAATADVAVIEGMMGLFDGVAGDSDRGSTAEIARWLDLPVLLVVDAGAMARSAAAVVQGFRDFDPHLRLAGVVFNRVGGDAHLELLRAALAAASLPPCRGGFPFDPRLAIPERHLGLLTAAETNIDADALADAAERYLDVDAILGEMSNGTHSAATTSAAVAGRGDDVIIAVARDEAFSFYYSENLELLARAGATLVEFSPLHDARLPRGASGLYLGGGYPEVHAARLAANGALLAELRDFAAAGGLVYAECGGLMLLGSATEDEAGTRHRMAGVLPFVSTMARPGLTLGYREVTIDAAGFVPTIGARGHEFHRATLDPASVPGSLVRAYAVRDPVSGASTREGFRIGRTLASWVHLHFASAPRFAEALVDAARAARDERAAMRVR
jgi:cobyrinic acid a,c-diamide synthase